MKKTKLKRHFKIILIIIILAILCLLYFLFFTKNLKGKKIDDFIYQYDIKGEKDLYIPVEIRDDNIYYLIEKNKEYTLYKRSIYSDKEKLIGTIDGKYDYCTFENDYILCSNTIDDYYDYKLNKIFARPNDATNKTMVVYYQKKFLLLKDLDLYESDKLIKKIDLNDRDAYLFGDYVHGDNTYLIFFSPEEEAYLYYDILNDKYEKVKDLLWTKYDEGVYTLADGKIATYNVLNNDFNRYNDLLLSEYAKATALHNNIFYFIENNLLYSLDLKNNTISETKHKFNTDINIMCFDNNHIYLINNMAGNDINIYVIDIKKIDKKTYSINDFKKYMNTLVDKKIKELEDKYHIDIVYKEDAKMENKTFKTTVLDNDFVLVSAIDSIEYVLKKFNKEFFEEFIDDKHKGLIMYLTGEIITQYGVDTTLNPSGYTLSENNQYEIVIDSRGNSMKSTICHELMHATDNRLKTNLYYEWFKKNPKNFDYAYSYTDSVSGKYTIMEEKKDKVYFVDTYAKSYPGEDVARIFENVCDRDEHTFILEYPHLLDKALYIKEVMEKEFPSLKNATVFNSLQQ